MTPDELQHALLVDTSAKSVLGHWGLRDIARGRRNLIAIRSHLGAERLAEMLTALGRILARSADADLALNSLERFLAHPAGNAQLPALLEHRARGLDAILQVFAVSQFAGDLLATNPDFASVLRIPARRLPTTAELQAGLQSEIDAAENDAAILRLFRHFRQKQILRIGGSDVARDRPIEEITRDISRVADVAISVALATAWRNIAARFGTPQAEGQEARCVVIAFGKLGGQELNYSSDIDLMFIYDREGQTAGRRGSLSNAEFFTRTVTELIRLLSAHTEQGQAYRIDLRLRPEGARGPLARSLESTLKYYDTLGRTWERQALIKARVVAGNAELGAEFLQAVEPFVYRKYLSFAEINEIKAMKRRIEQQVHRSGGINAEVKTGRGGIRDIEFAIQFLQLLNGGDLPQVRCHNTFLAMQALKQVGCLTDQEFSILDDAYRFLRKTEHRLQLLFDLQTHRLPEQTEELRKLALRMGYASRKIPSRTAAPLPDSHLSPQRRSPLDEADGPTIHTRQLLIDPLDNFLHDYHEKTGLTRKILEHLLHSTFSTDSQRGEPESDLILDPHPDEATIRAVIGQYPFRDVQTAFQNLTQLAQESVPFLSTRRCRHFLASIAPQLLRAVAETPDPDLALNNLEKVTASLGAKGVLWELFSFSPPSLRLYVDICANSQFLSDVLINNPGMIDEVLDSLVLNRPRSAEEMRSELVELCRNAADPEPILQSFRDKELLRIGTRDLLGKDDVRATNAALSDLAEMLLCQVATLQEPLWLSRYGTPTLADSEPPGRPARFVILALGKLGGREMSYHSDLDLVLIYEGDGRTTRPPQLGSFIPWDSDDNFFAFTQLAQRIIRALSQSGPTGRLYPVDMRLRPTGKSGSLVLPLGEFRRYYEQGSAQVWERLALTRGRVVYGDPDFASTVTELLRAIIGQTPWHPSWVSHIRQMRERLEASCSGRNLKRCPGGVVDVEFLIQTLQLRYARQYPQLLTPCLWEAIEALESMELLTMAEYQTIATGYRFLRSVESRLRIVTNRSQDDLPDTADGLDKLARRLGFSSGDRFLAEREAHHTRIRQVYQRVLARCEESI